MEDFNKQVLELQKETNNKSHKLIQEYYYNLYSIDSNTQNQGHNHYHICDFKITKNGKEAVLACKKYLRTKHMKRDKCMSCCDNADCEGCKHMKFILVDETDTIIACF